MISAFGVDHGESVEKAFGAGILRSVGTGIGQAARQGARASGQMAGKNLAKPGMRTMGRAQIKMGQGLKKVSNFAMQRPGAVGGAATGAAGVGAFGTGVALGSNRNKRY